MCIFTFYWKFFFSIVSSTKPHLTFFIIIFLNREMWEPQAPKDTGEVRENLWVTLFYIHSISNSNYLKLDHWIRICERFHWLSCYAIWAIILHSTDMISICVLWLLFLWWVGYVGGVFYYCLFYVIFASVFLIKQLLHPCLLNMRRL